MAPGFIVQLPAGSPFKVTLPVVGVGHAGWTTDPNVGADGVTGCTLIVKTACDEHVISNGFLAIIV
jgi:hypothetical protein